MTTKLRLRRAAADDARLFWEWVNDPEVRRASFSSKPIAWDEHLAWFEARLCDPGCVIFIVCDGIEKPVGQVRFEPSSCGAVISISVAAEARGRGLAVPMITQAVKVFFDESQATCIEALIRRENERSQRAFAAAGFHHAGDLLIKNQPAMRFVLQRLDV